jgi:hypothetical protein
MRAPTTTVVPAQAAAVRRLANVHLEDRVARKTAMATMPSRRALLMKLREAQRLKGFTVADRDPVCRLTVDPLAGILPALSEAATVATALADQHPTAWRDFAVDSGQKDRPVMHRCRGDFAKAERKVPAAGSSAGSRWIFLL